MGLRIVSVVSYDREQKLIKRYGIRQVDFEQIEYLQGGGCSICGKEVPQLVVDHCHKNGQVRSLLCRECNLALAHVNEDENILRKMIAYVRTHKGELNND
jgi:hydrogenase maturation factor